MDIKNILQNFILTERYSRYKFIENFLYSNNITYNLYKYEKGINIELIKKGLINKEIIFFSHWDISNDTIDGANDNSSSVSVFLKLALWLKDFCSYYTIKIIFNDKEEILGALLNTNLNIENIEKIIKYSGSFQYLKNYCSKKNVVAIFNLELSGIGDSIYIADRSGYVNCSKKLINYLVEISQKGNFKSIVIPVLPSDMISIHTLGYEGVVFGAIPYYEAQHYLLNKNNIPSVWKNIHSFKDNIFSIQEKSLNMIYEYLIVLIKNLNKL